jgi:hypothetical protein
MSPAAGELGLRAGDWVEVRSKQEILATLDKKGQLDSLPFMPQMFDFCGKRLKVVSAAHKTCDTINKTGGRRMHAAVHLEGVRCDGAAYDGCGAACLIFWKEAWLKRADGPSAAAPQASTGNGAAAPAGAGCTVEDVVAGTRAPGPPDDKGPTYVCQVTQLLEATSPLPWWDARQYVEDYRSGNVGLRKMVDGLVYSVVAKVIKRSENRPRVEAALISLYDRVQALRGGVPYPRKVGTIPEGQKTPVDPLNLMPGELVRVKTHQQILDTLDTNSKNRGLYYDAEHVPYCGGTYRVRSRVNRIVNEKTGKMLEMKTPSVILDGVYCQSRYSDRRMFCPRGICSYWRENWLERAEPAKATPAPAPTARVAPETGQ